MLIQPFAPIAPVGDDDDNAHALCFDVVDQAPRGLDGGAIYSLAKGRLCTQTSSSMKEELIVSEYFAVLMLALGLLGAELIHAAALNRNSLSRVCLEYEAGVILSWSHTDARSAIPYKCSPKITIAIC